MNISEQSIFDKSIQGRIFLERDSSLAYCLQGDNEDLNDQVLPESNSQVIEKYSSLSTTWMQNNISNNIMRSSQKMQQDLLISASNVQSESSANSALTSFHVIQSKDDQIQEKINQSKYKFKDKKTKSIQSCDESSNLDQSYQDESRLSKIKVDLNNENRYSEPSFANQINKYNDQTNLDQSAYEATSIQNTNRIKLQSLSNDQNTPQNQGEKKEKIQNFEKAALIINCVLKKSMNRGEKVKKHVRNFISRLKTQSQNRKCPNMHFKEYSLFNDLSHYLNHESNTRFEKLLQLIVNNVNFSNPFPVFMPTDLLRVCWDIFQVIFTYSFIYFYSILMFFAQHQPDSILIQLIFKYTFFIFLIDVMINFNTAYFDKDIIIADRKKIAQKYIFSHVFLTDSINLIIMGSKVIFQSITLVYNPQDDLMIFGINFLIFLKLNGISQKRNRFDCVFTLKESQKHIIRLLNQLLSVIAIAHIVSLGWYFLGLYEIKNGYPVTWLSKANIEQAEYFEKYIFSLYWSITTMTTVGYGDISATNYVEATFISLNMILFSCVFAYSINNIGFILQEIQKSSKKLNDNISTIQRYLNRKNVNISLQSRVRHYLSFLAEEQKDRDQKVENEILDLLSNKLRDEITLEINIRVLKNFSIFGSNFSAITLRKLVFIMKEVLISPNEIIFEEGDIDDNSIYLIESGIIEIYQINKINNSSSNNRNRTHLLQTLGSNQLFGDISFFSGLRRKACARSVNLSTLYKINRQDFINILLESVEDFERFKMMEEEIKFQKDISQILIQCYVCNKAGHIASNCPQLHKVVDTQFLILKQNFTLFQERKLFNRSKGYPKIYDSRQQVKKNKEVCKDLKDNLRNLNSEIEIMFLTEPEFITQSSNISHSDEDEYLTTTNSSQSQSCSSVSSPTKLKESSTMKIGSSHRIIENKNRSQKKLGTQITSQLKIKKQQNGKNNDGNSQTFIDQSYKNIENLESFINGQLFPQNFNSMQQQNQQNQQKLDVLPDPNNFITKRTSLSDTQSEHSNIYPIEEQNENDSSQSMNTTTNNPSIKKTSITQQNNLSQKEPSINNMLTSNYNSNNNSEDIEHLNSKQRKKKDRTFTVQALMQRKQTPDILDEQKTSKLKRHTHKKTTFKDEIRKSIVDISNVLQAALIAQSIANVNNQIEIIQMKNTVNNHENSNNSNINNNLNNINDERKKTIMTQKSKSISSNDHISVNNNMKSNSPASLIFRNGNNPFQDIKLSPITSQLQNQDILNSPQSIRENSQLHHLDNKQSNASSLGLVSNGMIEKLQKMFGDQSQFINGLKQQNNNNYANLSMDYFESMRNYKRFFPHNNFEVIIEIIRTKQQEIKKQKKVKIATTIVKNRRGNIACITNSTRKSIFCNAIMNRFNPIEVNYDKYKPTFLSYGVSQKSDSIFPKNNHANLSFNDMIANAKENDNDNN